MYALILTVIISLGIFFYIRLNHIRRRLTILEQQIWYLQQRAVTPPQPSKTSLVPESPQEIKVISPPKKSLTPISPIQREKVAQIKQPIALKLPATREQWEALLGGKISNRIGALALIIGVGFFLQYAFENQWITEEIRVIAGGVVGLILLLGGVYYYRKEMPVFAQGLFGTGIAILYLSIYAAFNFYVLISQSLAIVCMSSVTLCAFLLALKYDSSAISLLGLIGGFLTPFMLSTNQENPVGLFTYLAILNLGLVIILFIKFGWLWLQSFALFGTFLIYFLWLYSKFKSNDWEIALGFGTLFWLYFFILDLRYILKKVVTYVRTQYLTAILNLLCFYLALVTIFDVKFIDWQAEMTLILACIYFVSLIIIRHYQPENQAVLNRYGLISIILLIIATAIKFDDNQLIAFWSIEAAILFWCGIHYRLSKVWWSALGLFGLAILGLLLIETTFATDPVSTFRLLFNLRVQTFVILIVSLISSQFLAKKLEHKNQFMLKKLILLTWSGLLFLLISVEIIDYFRLQIALGADEKFYQTLKIYTLNIIWILVAIAYFFGGVRFKNDMALSIAGILTLLTSLIVIGFGLLVFYPIERFFLIFNIRTLCFLVLVIGLSVIYLFDRQKINWPNWLRLIKPAFLFLIIFIGFIWLSREIFDYFELKKYLIKQKSLVDWTLFDLTSNRQQLFLSGGWLFYSIFLLILGIWQRLGKLRLIAMVLFGITIFKIFIFDLSFLTSFYRIFSFIGLGIVLLTVSYLYHRFKYLIFEE